MTTHVTIHQKDTARNDTLVVEWCEIAGGIEDGEKAWEAALREVKEEAGLVCGRFYSADICEQ